MSRIRKAWRVSIKGYDTSEILYAPTAGKARSRAYHSIDNGDVRIIDVVARRADYADVELPDRSPIADLLSKEEAHCLLHAFGGNDDPVNAGKRDYYYTRRNDPQLLALAERGLMKPMDGDQYGENMTYFILTPEGKNVALSMVREYRI
jgi:hypothetical protein